MSDNEDDEETFCPLCVEEMDLSDRNFLPCPCGYRVCMWCWHHIRENLNGLCPACRTPYNADPHAFSAVDRHEIVKKNKERKQKEKQERKTNDRPVALTTASAASTSAAKAATANATVDRRHLHNYRVVQRNLVYVIGVPSYLASEELLRKAEYFGQYGKIGKVVIHKNHASAAHTSVSAYVTFVFKEDAKASIQSLDGFYIDGHVLRASFGTTKYCNNFIRGIACNNPDCVYLHDLGDDDDRFTKEEIQAGHSKLAQVPGQNQSIVTGNGGPSGTGKRPAGEPVLPPPVFIQDNAPPAPPASTPSSSSSSKGAIPRTSTWSGSIAEAAASANATPTGAASGAGGGGSYSAAAASTPSNSASPSAPAIGSAPPLEPSSVRLPPVTSNSTSNSAKVSASSSEGHSAQSMPVNRTKEAASSNSKAAAIAIATATTNTAAATTKDEQTKVAESNSSKKCPPSSSSAAAVESRKSQEAATPIATTTTAITRAAAAAAAVTATSPAPVAAAAKAAAAVEESKAAVPKNEATQSQPQPQPQLQPPQAVSHPPLNSVDKSSLGLGSSSFNGISRSAVFPVPISSLTISVWSAILQPSAASATAGDLNINPFGHLLRPLSELLDLTLPPVDAMCQRPWPKPQAYYSQAALQADCGPSPGPGPGARLPLRGPTALASSEPTVSAPIPNPVSNPVPAPSQQPENEEHEAPATSASSSSSSSSGTKPAAAPNAPNISALKQIFPGVNIAPAAKK